MKKTKKHFHKIVIKGSLIHLSGVFIARSLGLVLNIVIANVFGAALFGRYAICVSVINFSETFGMLGLHRGGMKFFSKAYKDNDYELQKAVVGISLFLAFFSTLIVAILLYFLTDVIGIGWFRDPNVSAYLKILAFSVPFAGLLKIAAFISKGYQTTKYSVLSLSVVAPAFLLFFFVVIYFSGYNENSIFLANVLSKIAGFLFMLWILWTLLFSKSNRRNHQVEKTINVKTISLSLLSYSWPFIFIEMLGFILSSTDLIMLGRMSDPVSVGVYAAASRVTVLMLIVLQAINSIFSPMVASMNERDAEFKNNISNLFRDLTRWMMIFSLPILLFFIFAGPGIMRIFGENFTGIGPIVLIILGLGTFINLSTGSVGVILNMTGNQKKELGNTLMLGFMNIILNLVLIPKYGAVGASFSTLTSIACINLLRVWQVYKLYKFHPFFSMHFVLIPIAFIIFHIVYSGSFIATPENKIYQIAMGAAIALSTLLFCFMVYTSEDEKKKIKQYTNGFIFYDKKN